MEKKYTLKRWSADTAGVCAGSQDICIHAELYGRNSNGILLYDGEGAEPVRIDFTEEIRLGNIYRGILSGISPEKYTYLFHEDGKPVMDPLAKRLTGHRLFGKEHAEAGDKDALRACVFVEQDAFDWQSDKKPKTAYEDSVYYGMHVRGFSKDHSSRIREAGTFAGVQKKIPYLKKLGITGIVLQPVYEFEECMKVPENRTALEPLPRQAADAEMRLNYWGYLPGYYMAPKNAYANGEDAVTELKTLVRQLHRDHLEIILQFYFAPSVTAFRVRDILLYWAKNYHIDGFELLGAALPFQEIALEPGLSDTKIWGEGFSLEEITKTRTKERFSPMSKDGRRYEPTGKGADANRFLANTGKEYRNTVRQFLKGDGGQLSAFLQCQRHNPAEYGQINFLASYSGFRLADVFSYEHKHNEENGEENRDGEDINYSWNCGVEGETRKKSILALRQRLLKNALTTLFTAQGTPFLFMGDEWGKSSGGNNNPYCQDNELTWQKWNLKKPEKELLDFTRELIALRKAHGVMRQKKPLTLMDHMSCGAPDLSYHGAEAWRTNMDYQTRHIGMMLCGKYCMTDGKEEDCLYIAYNMHWEPRDFALPKPFKNRRWRLLLNTAKEYGVRESASEGTEIPAEGENAAAKKETYSDSANQCVTLPERSVRIYISEEIPKLSGKRVLKSNSY